MVDPHGRLRSRSTAGSIASLRLHVRRPAAAVALLLAFAAARPATFASGLGLPLIAAYSLAAGAAMSTASILWMAMLQQHIPAQSLSRVDSMDAFGTCLLKPVGYLMAGSIAATIRLHPAMVLLGAIALLVSLATLASRDVRRLGWVQSPKRESERDRKHRRVTAAPLPDPSG